MSCYDGMENEWNVECKCGWRGMHEELHCHPLDMPQNGGPKSIVDVAFDRCPACNSREVKLKGEERFYYEGYTAKHLQVERNDAPMTPIGPIHKAKGKEW